MTRNILLALGALTLAACGQQPTTAEAPEAPAAQAPAATQQAQMTDAQFMQAAVNADAFAIEASELAARRATRQDVRTFAASMAREHAATTQELVQLAPTLSLAPPAAALDAETQGRIETLRSLSGGAFDDAYLGGQVEAHESAVHTFETYLAGAQTGPLRDWAVNTLAKLRTQLTQVQNLESAS